MLEDEMVDNLVGPEGCYLVYDTGGRGRLVLFYSKGQIPRKALGFWCAGPGRSIQGFKFKQNGGKVELIKGIAGGDSNRRKYFSGWCQFIKLAKSFNGYVIKFPKSEQGVEVDVIGYKNKEEKAYELYLDAGLIEVGFFDAISVVPKYNTTFHGIHKMPSNLFLEAGQQAGAATTLS